MEKNGILGGGQLAIMIESVRKNGIISISVLYLNKNCPAGLIGAYKNEEDKKKYYKNIYE